MPITAALIGGGASLLGGLFGGRSAERASRAQAAAQERAAQLAAEEARFRPVGVTTRFGRSTFEYGPEGRVSGAGYEVSPELRAYQDRLMGLAGRGLTQAEQAQGLYAPLMGAATGLFGAGQQYLTTPADQRLGELAGRYLGGPAETGVGAVGQGLLGRPIDQQVLDIARQQLAPSDGAETAFGEASRRLLAQPVDQQLTDIARQQLAVPSGAQALTNLGAQYVAQSPQEAAQQYMARQQELLAPSRERQYAQLQNQLFQTGRGGLSVGATGARPSGAAGLGATTPETEAYYNALAQQDAALAAQAQQAGQQQAQFGAGLLSTGQALGQGQIGFGADLLARQQAQEAQRLGLASTLAGQQQALGQGRLGFGVNLLAGEQARELARIGTGAGLVGQEQALGLSRYGFGADLLGRQQALEQGRLGFGAGLFGTAGNLLGQMYGGQTAALAPYQAYLGGATSLESLGQQPLDLGINIGAKGMSPTAASVLYGGGIGAAQSQFAANAYNPFATALSMGARNPQLVSGLSGLFGGGTGRALDYSSPIYGGYSLNQLQTMPYGT